MTVRLAETIPTGTIGVVESLEVVDNERRPGPVQRGGGPTEAHELVERAGAFGGLAEAVP